MSLINCEINGVFLIWSEEYIIVKPKFAITDTNLYVPVVTVSAQDNKNYCSNKQRKNTKI